jgi:hypothetical protein
MVTFVADVKVDMVAVGMATKELTMILVLEARILVSL